MPTETPPESCYTLRFPFQLAPGRDIANLHAPCEREIDGLLFRFERQGTLYVLTVSGLPSAEAATAYLQRVWAGLMWVVLHHGVAFNAELDFAKVVYTADPQEAADNLYHNFGLPSEGGVDGLVDGNFPAVYRSNKRIRFVTVNPVNLVMGSHIDQFYSRFAEGISIPHGTEIITDAKLKTALDLYAAYFYEHSANARFLTLVMALETLTDNQPKPPFILAILDQWQRHVEHLKGDVQSESDEHAALEALERELLFRREASLRSQIRSLVHRTLEDAGNPDAQVLARQAVRIYDKRSTLVHEGTLPDRELRQAESDAKRIVEMVLKAKFVLRGEIGQR